MKSFALILVTVTTVLLISGLIYYFLAPVNWGAGEFIMHFHLWIGFVFVIYFVLAIKKHIKENKNKCYKIKFKNIAYVLLSLYTIVLLSGLAHFVPYISYLYNPIYYRFETYALISNVHLYSAVIVILFFMLHLSMKSSKEKNEIK